MQKQTFLTTKQVDLILLLPEDAETITPWFHDAEVTQYLSRGVLPMTNAYEREFLANAYTHANRLMLGIYHREDRKLVGITGLHDIHEVNQTASYGVCIGEKEYWSKGIGTEVLQAMLEYAFLRRNLRNVTLAVLSNNPRGRRCYAKCGFIDIGMYPKHVFKNGIWHDEHLMIAFNVRPSA